jgi:hypothetical protein
MPSGLLLGLRNSRVTPTQGQAAGRQISRFWLPVIVAGFLMSADALAACSALAQAPGGFIEQSSTTSARPLLSASQIQALLPARGLFTFPAPYLTQGVRITNDTDCASATDCVNPVGYSYWRRINNHVGSDTMLIFLNLDKNSGGVGSTLFSYNKVTDQVTNVGPLFTADSPLSWENGEGWYFSATRPTALYLNNSMGTRLFRYDVLAKTFETVFDVSTRPDLFGTNSYIWQMHSSFDDRVHSATLRASDTYASLGCLVYREDTATFFYFPRIGDFDECQIDASGRWLLIKENVDAAYGEDNRIIDLANNNAETTLLDQNGAAGHSDSGFGYMVAADNWDSHPGALKLWKFGATPLQGVLVHYSTDWNAQEPAHVSHLNARTDVAPESQYACGSTASRTTTSSRANEVICFPLDGSQRVLVVAPVMTDLDAAGGGSDYAKFPKGNLDITGQYFIWTSNMGGNRLDAFIVKVPGQLLTALAPSQPPPSDTTPPTVAITGPASGATVSGTVNVTVSASDNVAVTTLKYYLDGSLLAVSSPPVLSLPWNSTSAGDGAHTLAVTAIDGAGNSSQATSSFTVSNHDPLYFSSASYSVRTSATSATITVLRSGPTDGTVSVKYATSNGTAKAGVNYQATSGTLTFQPGVTVRTFTVKLIKKSIRAALTVNLTLSTPGGGALLGTPSKAVLTIQL